MPRRVSQATIDGLADIMPGGGLINHEWQKHGICSGLNQANYFATLRRASRSGALPKGLAGRTLAPREIEQAFIAANPRMSAAGIAVTCNRGLLQEVRICLTKDLSFRRCLEVDRQGCHVPEITVPAGARAQTKTPRCGYRSGALMAVQAGSAQNLKATPSMRSLAVWLTVAPPTVAEPRSVWRYSSRPVTLLVSAASMPAPSVQPVLVVEAPAFLMSPNATPPVP